MSTNDNSQSRLYQDYLELLNMYGFDPPTGEMTLGARMKLLRRMGSKSGNRIIVEYSQQMLRVIDELDKHSGNKVKKKLEEKVQDGTGELGESINIVLSLMEETDKELLKEVYFNVFPTSLFNAKVYTTPNGVLCLLNRGLIQLLNNISFACCYHVRSEDSKIIISEDKMFNGISLSTKGLCLAIVTVVNYILNEHYDSFMINPFIIQSESISSWGGITALHISLSMQTFVVAHEIAHIVLGHLNKDNNIIQTSNDSIRIFSISHKMEYCADNWAQEILMKRGNNDYESLPFEVGGICFLIVDLIINLIRRKIYPNSIYNQLTTDTHPLSIDRIEAINKIIHKQKDAQMINSIWSLSALFMRIYENAKSIEIDITGDSIILHIDNESYTIKKTQTVLF